MNRYQVRIVTITAVILAAFSGCAGTPSVKEELDTLKQNQAKMQKDLDDIKSMFVRKPAEPPKPFQPSPVSIQGAPTQGKLNAPLTLVEFTDYQCPFCQRHANNTLPQIMKEYVDTGKLKYVIRDLPLKQIHANASKLAQATLCAGDQGKAWAMHDRIFKSPKAPDPNNLTKVIRGLGLNKKLFKTCLNSDKYMGAIDASITEGSQLGLRGTPGFYIGKTDNKDTGKIQATEMLVGAQPYAAFKQLIDKALNGKK